MNRDVLVFTVKSLEKYSCHSPYPRGRRQALRFTYCKTFISLHPHGLTWLQLAVSALYHPLSDSPSVPRVAASKLGQITEARGETFDLVVVGCHILLNSRSLNVRKARKTSHIRLGLTFFVVVFCFAVDDARQPRGCERRESTSWGWLAQVQCLQFTLFFISTNFIRTLGLRFAQKVRAS